ncbi:MAG: LacI family DNA-binding transcriptional regulator [Lactobacillus amylovorus]|uniref:LacI family DNA-binding transcriptional regulator n=1 Tax=Lactobacillus amylovorus TaxID=1604 RepID=UPI00201DED94|nr:LacI family DNA-binding transcriptional regulator [Lactobacillus amylovorus]MCI7336216.1 LacI family DNA-binding transcriptional regulator [Lactobacillus amylovorus]MDY2785982.1 LacI family DNA-binding transcriptional regulator [Lactobacillus amylovorus]MDY4730124.1 LacI family DNA-binding transcriptional regulator [Lactobacillus amylovorus]
MATMKDVAQRAGVGVGTVSRVINHVPGVKESTLIKVNQAIKELNYIPDEYARGLKTKSSRTIALILPSVWYPFFSEFAYYVEKRLDKENYKLLLCNSNGNPTEEAKYIKMLKQNKIDAIIAITYSDIEQYIYSNIPFVSLDRYFDKKVSYVTSDNYEGGKLAARKLLEHGARSLAYVGSHSKYPNGTMLRRDGFRDYLENIGIDYKEIFLQEPVNDFTPYILEMLKVHPKIDGIFCHTDSLLLKLRKILNQYGYRVPEDIQLIGFDGMNLSSDLPLGISTIAQPVEQLANGAVDLVLRKIADPSLKNEAKMYPVRYVDGNTTK